MATLSELRTRFRAFYPEATDEIIDTCLKHAVQKTSVTLPAIFGETDLSLVQNQSVYSIPTGVLFLYQAHYVSSAGVRTELEQITPEELSLRNIDFLSTSTTGAPRQIMFQGGEIRLWPIPDTTTSGGLPKVVLYHVKSLPELSDPNDTTAFVYVVEHWILAPALTYYASMRVKQDLSIREYEEAKAWTQMTDFLLNRGIDMRPRINPRPRLRPYV